MDCKQWYSLLPYLGWEAVSSRAAQAPLQEHNFITVSLSTAHRRWVGAVHAVRTSREDAEIHPWCFMHAPSTAQVFAPQYQRVCACRHLQLEHRRPALRTAAETLRLGEWAAVWWQQCSLSSCVCAILGPGSGGLVLFCWVWWAAAGSRSVQRNSKLNSCFQKVVSVPVLSPCLSLALTHRWLHHWEPGRALFFMLL